MKQRERIELVTHSLDGSHSVWKALLGIPTNMLSIIPYESKDKCELTKVSGYVTWCAKLQLQRFAQVTGQLWDLEISKQLGEDRGEVGSPGGL